MRNAAYQGEHLKSVGNRQNCPSTSRWPRRRYYRLEAGYRIDRSSVVAHVILRWSGWREFRAREEDASRRRRDPART